MLVEVRDDRTLTAVSGEHTGECLPPGIHQNPLRKGRQKYS